MTICFGVLPVLTLLILYVFVSQNSSDFRQAYLHSLLVWGTGIVAVTEVLSLFHALNRTTVFAAWIVAIVGLSTQLLRIRPPVRSLLPRPLRAPFECFPILLAVVVMIAGAILVNGLIAAPNYWDALTYHMPRVMHWIQNGTVDHYLSNNTRQLAMPPFTEYIILHLQLLTGSDRFAAFPQWLSMISSLVIVDLIAERLGANRNGRLFAVIFAASIPVGILEASSVQTDYVAAMWLLAFAYFVLLSLKETSGRHLAGLGAALGLALLTKATAYLYALPFVLWFAVATFRWMPRNVPRVAFIVGSMVLLFNLGHYTRNWISFSSPLGSPLEFEQSVNGRFGFDVTLSNMIRNASMHLGLTPLTSDALTDSVGSLHAALGLDVDDPETTWGGLKFTIWPLSPLENKAGNPVHFVSGVVSMILVFALPALRANKSLILYVLAVVLGFIFFSAYLRWTQVHQRLHLPLFLLFAPVPGVLVGRSLRPLSVHILSFGLLILALPYTFSNGLRPLLPTQYAELPSVLTTPRIEQYFYELPEVEEQFRGAAETIAETFCTEIGLFSGNESFEYLLWVLLPEKLPEYRIHHVTGSTALSNGQRGDDFEIENERICLHIYMRYVDAYQMRGSWSIEGEVLYASDFLTVTVPNGLES